MWIRHLWIVQMDSSHEMRLHLRESSYNSWALYLKCLLAVFASLSTEATFTYFYFLCGGFLVIVEYLHKMVSLIYISADNSWAAALEIFGSFDTIICIWPVLLWKLKNTPASLTKKKKERKKTGFKKMLHQYQLPCRSVKVGVRFDFHLKKWNWTRKTQFASFAYELHFSLEEVATSCALAHTFKFAH